MAVHAVTKEELLLEGDAVSTGSELTNMSFLSIPLLLINFEIIRFTRAV